MTQEETWLLEEKYNGEKTEGFFADCVRLTTGEPLAYIIGSIPFLNTTIFLDSKPLIPRTETEFWVEQVMRKITPDAKVLDLCAGSGCIGVSILKNVPESLIDFCEIDERHHPTIKKNILENDIDQTRTHIFSGDLFENITDTYDVVLSNPPYIDPAIDRADASVKKYEPEIALYGGVAGMEVISRIITESPRFLNPHGILVLEHEPEQTAAIHELGVRNGFSTETYPDQFGTERFTYLIRTK